MADEKKFLFSCLQCEGDRLPQPIERNTGRYVRWGEDNAYPQYLWQLYLNNAVLGSIINSIADFVCGDAIINGETKANEDGETMSDVIRKVAFDLNIFGGFALQVLRNIRGDVSEVYVLDFRKVRVNDTCTIVTYNSKFGSFGMNSANNVELPVFDANNPVPNSVFYFKGYKTRDAYPIPPYHSAIKQVETGIRIGNFHLNAIKNGLSSNYLINFNGGQPTEEVRKEIERKLVEKFTGDEATGRPMISWNKNKDTAVTIEKIPQDDFDKKYEALAKDTLNAICVAMRCAPVLIGMNPEGTGFNSTEYKELYTIFNKTTIEPLQRQILGALKKIFGYDVVTIVPYNIANEIKEGE